MKLQKQLSQKRGDKKYFRYTINISQEVIKEAGFKEGDELKAEVKNGEIRVRRE